MSICAIENDPEADFAALFRQTYPDISAYCRRRLPPDQAADATAETFAVAWERFAIVPTGERARLWLFGVARHKVEHQRRRQRSRLRLVARLAAQPWVAIGATDVSDAGDDLAGVLAEAERLPPKDLELLRLVAWEGLSHAEVAMVLELSTNAVAIRLHRIRKKLRTAMKEPGPEEDVMDRTANATETKEDS